MSFVRTESQIMPFLSLSVMGCSILAFEIILVGISVLSSATLVLILFTGGHLPRTPSTLTDVSYQKSGNLQVSHRYDTAILESGVSYDNHLGSSFQAKNLV